MKCIMGRPRATEASSVRRGAIQKGCLIGLGCVVVLVVIAGLTGVGQYNSLVSSQEDARQKWAEVENQYKRRNDLISNLVETVKGASNFEQETLTQVTEARASVGRAQLPTDLPTDAAQLDAYIRAQQSLGSALSRLMVVVEQYPELRTTENFLSLQDQLEGTENRITKAREDYTMAVQRYNTGVRSFPKSLFAGMLGFQPLPQFTILPEESAVPKVDFGKPR